MLEEKLYSIAEIAKITKLTDRTIRNYLANGTLKGRKIGGQWRFTKDDIHALFNSNDFEDDMKNKTLKKLENYFIEEYSDFNSSCIVLNLYIKDKKTRQLFYEKLSVLKNSDNNKDSILFTDDNGHIKIVTFSSINYASKILNLAKEFDL